jgi:GH24 family phage-related lysozyme (muramidase)
MVDIEKEEKKTLRALYEKGIGVSGDPTFSVAFQIKQYEELQGSVAGMTKDVHLLVGGFEKFSHGLSGNIAQLAAFSKQLDSLDEMEKALRLLNATDAEMAETIKTMLKSIQEQRDAIKGTTTSVGALEKASQSFSTSVGKGITSATKAMWGSVLKQNEAFEEWRNMQHKSALEVNDAIGTLSMAGAKVGMSYTAVGQAAGALRKSGITDITGATIEMTGKISRTMGVEAPKAAEYLAKKMNMLGLSEKQVGKTMDRIIRAQGALGVTGAEAMEAFDKFGPLMMATYSRGEEAGGKFEAGIVQVIGTFKKLGISSESVMDSIKGAIMPTQDDLTQLAMTAGLTGTSIDELMEMAVSNPPKYAEMMARQADTVVRMANGNRMVEMQIAQALGVPKEFMLKADQALREGTSSEAKVAAENKKAAEQIKKQAPFDAAFEKQLSNFTDGVGALKEMLNNAWVTSLRPVIGTTLAALGKFMSTVMPVIGKFIGSSVGKTILAGLGTLVAIGGTIVSIVFMWSMFHKGVAAFVSAVRQLAGQSNTGVATGGMKTGTGKLLTGVGAATTVVGAYQATSGVMDLYSINKEIEETKKQPPSPERDAKLKKLETKKTEAKSKRNTGLGVAAVGALTTAAGYALNKRAGRKMSTGATTPPGVGAPKGNAITAMAKSLGQQLGIGGAGSASASAEAKAEASTIKAAALGATPVSVVAIAPDVLAALREGGVGGVGGAGGASTGPIDDLVQLATDRAVKKGVKFVTKRAGRSVLQNFVKRQGVRMLGRQGMNTLLRQGFMHGGRTLLMSGASSLGTTMAGAVGTASVGAIAGTVVAGAAIGGSIGYAWNRWVIGPAEDFMSKKFGPKAGEITAGVLSGGIIPAVRNATDLVMGTTETQLKRSAKKAMGAKAVAQMEKYGEKGSEAIARIRKVIGVTGASDDRFKGLARGWTPERSLPDTMPGDAKGDILKIAHEAGLSTPKFVPAEQVPTMKATPGVTPPEKLAANPSEKTHPKSPVQTKSVVRGGGGTPGVGTSPASVPSTSASTGKPSLGVGTSPASESSTSVPSTSASTGKPSLGVGTSLVSPASAPVVKSSEEKSTGGGANKQFRDMIIRHEGLETQVYKDTKGLPTIGIGHLILPGEDFSAGISRQQALDLFDKDMDKHLQLAKQFPAWGSMDPVRKAAVADMTFNMGQFWKSSWPVFTKQMVEKKYREAGQNIRGTPYARQTKGRGLEIADMIESGIGPPLMAAKGAVVDKPSLILAGEAGKEVVTPVSAISKMASAVASGIPGVSRESNFGPRTRDLMKMGAISPEGTTLLGKRSRQRIAEGSVGNPGQVGPMGLEGKAGQEGLAGTVGPAGAGMQQVIRTVSSRLGMGKRSRQRIAEGSVGNPGQVGPMGLEGKAGQVGPMGLEGKAGEEGPAGAVMQQVIRTVSSRLGMGKSAAGTLRGTQPDLVNAINSASTVWAKQLDVQQKMFKLLENNLAKEVKAGGERKTSPPVGSLNPAQANRMNQRMAQRDVAQIASSPLSGPLMMS